VNRAQLYADAKEALASASRLETSMDTTRAALNAARWRAAEDMAALADMGETQRAIAAGVGVSPQTVNNYLRVWTAHHLVHARGQATDFGELLKEARGGWGHVPASTANKVKAAADFLAEREVWKDEAVQEVVRTQVRRDIREEPKAWTPPKDTTTPIMVRTGSYWATVLYAMNDATRKVREAVGELDRSGMPSAHAGDVIKAARVLATAASHLEERVAATAVGKPMEN
jgi:hypothetical protein